ncbi:disease resistance protein [Pyrus ussuriensis x Pyrus communis]|uniref:Disease resistance protein n=1 Tax=Pyrus ussuriensis x Pyrus communis TaxID=2448454 RepID=A0A5N5FLQ4_9ROSA|nr:disease resistance protein [Pyrus ussuriensis x Pyrus communis]
MEVIKYFLGSLHSLNFLRDREMEVIGTSSSGAADSGTAVDDVNIPPLREKYDVFISFRGEDTRLTFTSHLYDALLCKKIETYMDYRLERGDEIGPALREAIEKSRLSVIIFSKNYASSTWCLIELVHILKCKKKNDQMVVPIFYDISPSEVRKQEGSYADAFAELENRFKDRMDKVIEWKAALVEATSLSGFDYSNKKGTEADFIKEVVEDISTKLKRETLCDLKGMVGIESHIEQVESLLSTNDWKGVCTVGIWGMGGIGKTTLAKAVFNRLSSEFKACCFLNNVREKAEQTDGVVQLQKTLLREILKEENLSIDKKNVKERLSRTKVLIVFDDVSDWRQIKDLVGHYEDGSRIIVTSRERGVLKKAGTEKVQAIISPWSRIGEQNLDGADFKKMYNMRLLSFSSWQWWDCKINLKTLFLPNSLRYLFWRQYPLKSLPPEFSLENLVELHMPNSDVTQLWDGGQNPINLKVLNLRSSLCLTALPNLLGSPNIEHMDLSGCENLVEIPESFKNLDKLTYLDLSWCKRLEYLPKMPDNIEFLRLQGSGIKELTSSVRSHENLFGLMKKKLKKPPSSSCKLKVSGAFSLEYCSSLEKFWELPRGIGELDLSHTTFKVLPTSSMECLLCLTKLKLTYCKNLASLPPSIFVPSSNYKLTNIKTLSFSYCRKLRNFPQPTGSVEIPEGVICSTSLRDLNLSGTKIRSIPSIIKQASQLSCLYLIECESLRSLPELPMLIACLGFALSFVVSNLSAPCVFFECKYNFKTGEGENHEINCYFNLKLNNIRYFRHSIPQHVSVLYKDLEHEDRTKWSSAFYDLVTEVPVHFRQWWRFTMVEKCGMCLLYAEDAEKLKCAVMSRQEQDEHAASGSGEQDEHAASGSGDPEASGSNESEEASGSDDSEGESGSGEPEASGSNESEEASGSDDYEGESKRRGSKRED